MAEASQARRVLVVDDEPLIRWSLAQALSDAHCSVTQAESCAAALSALREDDGFDVVLLDLRLPDCGDLSLLQRIRRAQPRAAVILMTALPTPEVVHDALALGAIHVLGKPFEVRDVTALVQAC